MTPHAGTNWWNTSVYRSLSRKMAILAVYLVDSSVNGVGESNRLTQIQDRRGFRSRGGIFIASIFLSQTGC
jgi:hypothetical protein